ncbi:MAG TPA: ATP-binding protein, partial [Acidimicrobiia bacterium]|nr:ATP-binding protein [Acidimicrobiia bacterium]
RLIWLAIGALIALLIALTIADLTIGRRVRSLVGVTRQIGAGNLSARSDVGTGDEVGDLGKALDAMAAELRARDEERAQLLTKLVDASEEERRRIAGDVHDDSIQVMSAQVMGLQLLRRRVDDPELKARIQELEESGREATARLRDLVFYLHSPTLETHGLASAIDLLLDRSFEGETVEWSVKSALAEDPPPASRDTAYRIAQEAIGNARRHARAAHITVDLRRDGNELVMTIVDDGVGFSADGQADRPGHLGLRAARERAAAVGGAVVIDSAVGGGTRFSCRLPWNFDAVATPPNGERAAVRTDP